MTNTLRDSGVDVGRQNKALVSLRGTEMVSTKEQRGKVKNDHVIQQVHF